MMDGISMSLKKEMLSALSEHQLRELADMKGIVFTVSKARKQYYKDWSEKDKLVDIMSDQQQLTIEDIEKFMNKHNS